ncbi:MAG: cytochrome c oxidase assembly protein [Proteobacteria bacterium]|nr:cytochrome c oxidase assembly protein [Pseudomonadota bacterium]
MSQRDKKRHTTLLLALAVGMFGFAFALVPLYDVFCEITGLNGKTSGQAELLAEIDRSAAQEDREVKIEFLASVARGMSWEFRPMDKEIIVRPGTMNKTTFFVRNRSNKTVIGQAVPSVSPGQAAQYLKKIECFCFEQQKLMAGAEMEMGVTFYVDAELPAHINELTLSYTMFLVSDLVGSNEHEHLSSHNVR